MIKIYYIRIIEYINKWYVKYYNYSLLNLKKITRTQNLTLFST